MIRFWPGTAVAGRVPALCPCRRALPSDAPGTTIATVTHLGGTAAGPIVAVQFYHPKGEVCRWERANPHSRRWTRTLLRAS